GAGRRRTAQYRIRDFRGREGSGQAELSGPGVRRRGLWPWDLIQGRAPAPRMKSVSSAASAGILALAQGDGGAAFVFPAVRAVASRERFTASRTQRGGFLPGIRTVFPRSVRLDDLFLRHDVWPPVWTLRLDFTGAVRKRLRGRATTRASSTP